MQTEPRAEPVQDLESGVACLMTPHAHVLLGIVGDHYVLLEFKECSTGPTEPPKPHLLLHSARKAVPCCQLYTVSQIARRSPDCLALQVHPLQLSHPGLDFGLCKQLLLCPEEPGQA